jgi:hypothetical protein
MQVMHANLADAEYRGSAHRIMLQRVQRGIRFRQRKLLHLRAYGNLGRDLQEVFAVLLLATLRITRSPYSRL